MRNSQINSKLNSLLSAGKDKKKDTHGLKKEQRLLQKEIYALEKIILKDLLE